MLKLGKGEAALAKYDKAVSLDAAYADAHAGRARALLLLGRDKDALTAVEKAMEVTKYKPERYEALRSGILKRTSGDSSSRCLNRSFFCDRGEGSVSEMRVCVE